MQSSTVDKLKRISFFADMGEYDLGQIAEITEEKSYSKGEVIVEERTSAERFFIIYKGKIEITKQFEDGEEFVLAVHSDGDFFGEMALLDEGLRSATARAVAPTTVLEITRPNFETLLYKAPVVAYHIIRELSSRLRETGALLISFLQRRNRQLYRSYLDTITMIIRAVEGQPPGAQRQSWQVQRVARVIGQHMQLSEEEMLTLEINALIGGLGIAEFPEPLSLKPGALVQRIITVAAAFVALTYDRQGQPALVAKEVVPKLKRDKDLDPQILEVLQTLWKSKGLPDLGDTGKP
jgi:CRP-like cAMP-binding protein